VEVFLKVEVLIAVLLHHIFTLQILGMNPNPYPELQRGEFSSSSSLSRGE
jgi:hypothetical protein